MKPARTSSIDCLPQNYTSFRSAELDDKTLRGGGSQEMAQEGNLCQVTKVEGSVGRRRPALFSRRSISLKRGSKRSPAPRSVRSAIVKRSISAKGDMLEWQAVARTRACALLRVVDAPRTHFVGTKGIQSVQVGVPARFDMVHRFVPTAKMPAAEAFRISAGARSRDVRENGRGLYPNPKKCKSDVQGNQHPLGERALQFVERALQRVPIVPHAHTHQTIKAAIRLPR